MLKYNYYVKLSNGCNVHFRLQSASNQILRHHVQIHVAISYTFPTMLYFYLKHYMYIANDFLNYCHRVRTGHGKPGKSWNLLFQFPGLESHGI